MKDKEKYFAIAVLVAVVLALPLIFQKMKKEDPLDFGQIQKIYRENNISVGNEAMEARTSHGAQAEMSMTLNGASARLFLFETMDKLESAIPDLEMDAIRGISDSMSKDVCTIGRNGLYLMSVVSSDRDLRERMVAMFEGMPNPGQDGG